MSSNPNYKPSEGKREEFRKYLEKTGVMDALTKVLVSLYEEPDKPENAVEFICNKLASQVCGETLDSLKSRLEEAESKVIELQTELAAKESEEVPAEAEGAPAPPPEEEAAPPPPPTE